MTLYAIRPEPDTGSLDDAEVIDRLRYGWQFLEQAILPVDPAGYLAYLFFAKAWMHNARGQLDKSVVAGKEAP
jgi:hypothetical protein